MQVNYLHNEGKKKKLIEIDARFNIKLVHKNLCNIEKPFAFSINFFGYIYGNYNLSEIMLQ